MHASVLAISTVVPLCTFSQTEIAEIIIEMFCLDTERAEKIRYLYKNSAIHKRHTVIDDFKKNRADWKFWGQNYPTIIPTSAQRNEVYKIEAPKLAYEAASKAIKNWGGDPQTITHIVSVSCTGMIAPGIEFDLMQSLKLKPSVERLGINFMGCFGAFKGLSVAQAFAKENPRNRVLLVCTELCSLHFQVEQTPDNVLGNSLFSDGAAAVIVGMEPTPNEVSLWNIIKKTSVGFENTREKMKWEIGEHGFLMKLSHTIPVLLGRQIEAFTNTLVGTDQNYSNYDWAIHPGGKSIIQAIEKSLKLKEGACTASWEVLREYGNMSSATFLFVLERLHNMKCTKPYTVGLGFGPGLSIEGILLERPQ